MYQIEIFNNAHRAKFAQALHLRGIAHKAGECGWSLWVDMTEDGAETLLSDCVNCESAQTPEIKLRRSKRAYYASPIPAPKTAILRAKLSQMGIKWESVSDVGTDVYASPNGVADLIRSLT